MKNKLITALFTITTLSALAQQPNKAELLKHLKNVKTHAQSILKENSSWKFSLGYCGTKNSINMWNELYDAFDPDQTETIAEVAFYFDMICNKMKTIDDIRTIAPHAVLKHIGIIVKHKNTYKEQYALIFSIVRKHFSKQYWIEKYWPSKYTNGSLNDETLKDFLNSSDSICAANYIVYEPKVLKNLLPKINAKIAELEAQA